MILLDTNVLSELTKPVADHKVEAWFLTQPVMNLYLCDIVVMEQSYGVERFSLRTGSYRYLEMFNEQLVSFRGRILRFDHQSAIETGRIRARRERTGHQISVQDAMIAAICLAHGATLATRNTKDFEGIDLKLVNPFEGG
ncbi:type II toxin-antitoxin system VapC family toxin [Rhizobium jaguaris]|uniref:Type II toxin-antitoxin system VapC family toxin n=1 Tax=Rhizobium jaguaris TaxID=1312183 RepID=A0A387FHD1_9HYPH|nr:type II toxin-antitoxin system VapC family toxin [Rhizobium jaguaris]AYG57919.1 type II toxin-antitoxin system VapC family toxin [Rhizobium jaguaris]